MTHTTRQVTFRGNPAYASRLVQMLEEGGATVEWKQPTEQRGISEMGQGVIVAIVANGTLVAIQAAVARFRKHMHGRAAATIEDDEQDYDGNGTTKV